MVSELIVANVHLKSDTFLNELIDNSTFDKGKYNELVFVIAKTNDEINDNNRLVLAVHIWEICYMIQGAFYSDLNPIDIFKISKIDDEEKLKIMNDLYQIGNFFSWAKPMDFRDFLL